MCTLRAQVEWGKAVYFSVWFVYYFQYSVPTQVGSYTILAFWLGEVTQMIIQP